MSTETPFKISISDDKIAQLNAKLQAATFPDELDEAGWDYGTPLADVKRLVSRWKDGFDWKKHEKILNEELPQFTRDIEVDGFGTLNTHYVHKKSEAIDAIPLLFVHGCENTTLLSHCNNSPNLIIVILYRARKLHRSPQDSALANCKLARPPKLQRRRVQSAGLRILRR